MQDQQTVGGDPSTPETIDDALSVLTDRERLTIQFRFGIGTKRLGLEETVVMTPYQVAAGRPLVDTSKEAVREITKRALVKIIRAKKMDIFIRSVWRALQQKPSDFETEKTFFERNGIPFPETDHKNPAPRNIGGRIYDNIDSILGSLSLIEEKILRWRFGIGLMRLLPPNEGTATHSGVSIGRNGHTLEEIADELRVTPPRIRQIETKALRRMRTPARLNSLMTLFENGTYSEGILNFAWVVLGPNLFADLKFASTKFSEFEPFKNTGLTFSIRPLRTEPRLSPPAPRQN